MSGPGTPFDENSIKQLLASGDIVQRVEGLNETDRAFRLAICERLQQVCIHLGWRLDWHEIQDVWQMTMMNLMERVMPGHFDPAGSLSGLLWKFATCRAADLLRKRCAKKRSPERLVDPETMEVFGVDQDPALPLLDEELRNRIDACLGKLSSRLRVIVRAYFCLVPESASGRVLLADVLAEVEKRSAESLTPAAGKSRLERGLKRFRRCLGKDGDDE